MARELGDVLHLFLGEEQVAPGRAGRSDHAPAARARSAEPDRIARPRVATPAASADAGLRAIAWNVAQLLADRGPVLVELPLDAAASRVLDPLPTHCWLLAPVSDPGRAEFLARTERILARRPDAHIGLTMRGVEGLAEARDGFLRFAEIFEARFDQRLLSYGLVVDEIAVHRSWVRRRPVGLEGAEGRAGRCLRDIAQLLADDLPSPA